MFEGNISESGFEKAMDSGELRPLEWSALTARLSAARDLRQLVSNRTANITGNFDRFTSGPDANLNESPHGVNPTGLGERKDNGPNVPGTASDAVSGDREI